jgi:hypothetical protein
MQFLAKCWAPEYSVFMVSSLHQNLWLISPFQDLLTYFKENKHFSWKKNYQNQVIGKDEETVNGKG